MVPLRSELPTGWKMDVSAEDALLDTWKAYFRKSCKEALQEIAKQSRDTESVYVDWTEVNEYDQDLAEELLRDPYRVIHFAEGALQHLDLPLEGASNLHFRPENLPDRAATTPSEIKSDHLGRLISCTGSVKEVEAPQPHIVEAVFECKRCGAIIHEPQDDHLSFKEPLECYEDQNGCGRSQTSFKHLTGRSDFIDRQRVEIHDPQSTESRREKVPVYLDSDLAGVVRRTGTLRVNAIVRCTRSGDSGKPPTAFDIFLDAVSVEEPSLADVEDFPDDTDSIETFSRDLEATIEDLFTLTDRQFERLVARIYQRKGYDVELTPPTRDFGADVLAEKDGIRTLIEVKHQRNPVGSSVVQRAIGATDFHDSQIASVVSLGGFTVGAEEAALNSPVTLWDAEDILDGLTLADLAAVRAASG